MMVNSAVMVLAQLSFPRRYYQLTDEIAMRLP
jgi:hypothetical protein